jgi:endo-1,4-beta-xylanase
MATTAAAAGGMSAVLPAGCGGSKPARADVGRAAAPPELLEMNGPRSLRAHASAHDLLVGCAVLSQELDGDPRYASTVAEQASLIVPEDALTWQVLRPTADRFDFRRADDVVVWGLTHGQRMRGQTLCANESLPEWFAGTVNQQNAREFLVQHIQTTAGRYAGKLHSWDVVNGAIDANGGRADGLRVTPWLETIGPGYIELASGRRGRPIRRRC